jgi:hypothetical protein
VCINKKKLNGGITMKNKKLGITLLTLAVFTSGVQAENEKRSRKGVYQAKTPWPLAPVEDAVVGAGSAAAEIVTVGHANTGNAPTGLAVAVPDAIPGVSAARADKNSETNASQEKQTTSKRQRKEERERKSETKSTKSKRERESKTKKSESRKKQRKTSSQ